MYCGQENFLTDFALTREDGFCMMSVTANGDCPGRDIRATDLYCKNKIHFQTGPFSAHFADFTPGKYSVLQCVYVYVF